MTSIKKEFAILHVLGSEEALASKGLGVVRISNLIARERSQVSRALKTLEEYGFVDRDPETLRYSLGWQVFALAARAGDQRLINAAPPTMKRLVKNLDETAHVSILRGAEVVGVLQESSSQAIQAASWVGLSVPSYCTSSGRAVLLDHSLTDLRELFSGVEFNKLGPNTVSDVEQLYERILAARESGYACVVEELEPNLVAVGTPIRDFTGRIVAALNVEGPKYRLRGGRLETTKQEVRESADELSSLLGWSSTTQRNGRKESTRFQCPQSTNGSGIASQDEVVLD